jgi:hypothetical protein
MVFAAHPLVARPRRVVDRARSVKELRGRRPGRALGRQLRALAAPPARSGTARAQNRRKRRKRRKTHPPSLPFVAERRSATRETNAASCGFMRYSARNGHRS